MKKLFFIESLLFAIMMVFISNNYTAQCFTVCNDNTFLKSSDPNTLEYDNIISSFHSTFVREADGKIYLWGESTAPNGTGNLTSKTDLSAANGFGITSPILRMAAASSGAYNFSQFAVLTNEGLYVWGQPGYLIDSDIKNTNAFGAVSIATAGVVGTNTKGLPAGVLPAEVKMLFGSYKTLGLVTCTGEAWILSADGNKNGDGTSQGVGANNKIWHRVKTGSAPGAVLSNVVAMRGTSRGMMALTSLGEVYTWGTNVYLGDSVAHASKTYATNMTLPSGVLVKQIGMTENTLATYTTADPNAGVSYFIVSTAGKLYSLGTNFYRQLGDFTATNRTSWVRVKKSATVDMEDVAWVSPQEHDDWFAFVNALTTTGKIYAWGHNDKNMVGGATLDGPSDPVYMPGNLPNDVYQAVESGGHATIVVRKCSKNFGYIGHRVNGSMADNLTDGYEAVYTFNTSTLNLCGAATAPSIYSTKICNGTTIDLVAAFIGTVPLGSQLKFFTDSALTIEVANPTAALPNTYYASFIETGPLACANPPYTTFIVQYLVPSDPGYSACVCYDPAAGGTGTNTKQGITLLKRAGANPSSPDNWPMVRKSAHTVLESNTKGFVITRMTTLEIQGQTTPTVISPKITTPQDGMMVYDTDAKCLKIYTVEVPPAVSGWKCYSTPACP